MSKKGDSTKEKFSFAKGTFGNKIAPSVRSDKEVSFGYKHNQLPWTRREAEKLVKDDALKKGFFAVGLKPKTVERTRATKAEPKKTKSGKTKSETAATKTTSAPHIRISNYLPGNEEEKRGYERNIWGDKKREVDNVEVKEPRADNTFVFLYSTTGTAIAKAFGVSTKCVDGDKLEEEIVLAIAGPLKAVLANLILENVIPYSSKQESLDAFISSSKAISKMSELKRKGKATDLALEFRQATEVVVEKQTFTPKEVMKAHKVASHINGSQAVKVLDPYGGFITFTKGGSEINEVGIFKPVNYPVTEALERFIKEDKDLEHSHFNIGNIIPLSTHTKPSVQHTTLKGDKAARSSKNAIDEYNFTYVKDKEEYELPSGFFRTSDPDAIAWLMREIYTVNKVHNIKRTGLLASPFGQYVVTRKGKTIDLLKRTKGDDNFLVPQALEKVIEATTEVHAARLGVARKKKESK